MGDDISFLACCKKNSKWLSLEMNVLLRTSSSNMRGLAACLRGRTKMVSKLNNEQRSRLPTPSANSRRKSSKVKRPSKNSHENILTAGPRKRTEVLASSLRET